LQQFDMTVRNSNACFARIPGFADTLVLDEPYNCRDPVYANGGAAPKAGAIFAFPAGHW
jgi:hypothetical protein